LHEGKCLMKYDENVLAMFQGQPGSGGGEKGRKPGDAAMRVADDTFQMYVKPHPDPQGTAAEMAAITVQGALDANAERARKQEAERQHIEKGRRLRIQGIIVDIKAAAKRGAGSLMLGMYSESLAAELRKLGYTTRETPPIPCGPSDRKGPGLAETFLVVQWSKDGDQHWVFKD
jgi:hypothetical protein